MTLFSGFQFLATPLIGRLSDYYGRKGLLAICLFGTCVSNVLAFFAGGPALLYLARILDGITGGNNSVAQAVVSDITEPKDRPKAFGLFGASWGMAFIVGPLLSIPLQNISISAPFLGSALMALLATLLTLFLLPETLKQPETKPLKFKELGFIDILTGFKRPHTGPLLILAFLSSLVFGIFQFGFQPYILSTFQASTQDLSLVLLTYGIMIVVVQVFIVPQVVKKLGYLASLLIGLSGTAVVLSLFLVPTQFIYFLMLAPLFGLFAFMFRPVLSALVSTKSRKEDQGIALGLIESYGSLALTIGPFLGGVASEYNTGYPFYVAAGVAGVGIVFTLKNRRAINAKNKQVNY